MAVSVLSVRNFAQISEATVELADLTVLVGPQGTGKSLLLQWLIDLPTGQRIRNLRGEAEFDLSMG